MIPAACIKVTQFIERKSSYKYIIRNVRQIMSKHIRENKSESY